MFRSGLIIRLIDVVLILLFGFISISEISRKSKIDLPKSAQTPPTKLDLESILIIGISEDGSYLIENESAVITNFMDLKNYILKKNERDLLNNVRSRVRIRSNWNTPIRYTATLAYLCEALDIETGIDVIHKEP